MAILFWSLIVLWLVIWRRGWYRLPKELEGNGRRFNFFVAFSALISTFLLLVVLTQAMAQTLLLLADLADGFSSIARAIAG